MHAVLRRRYGSPDALTFEEVEPPGPGPDQVLVRVHASSVNAYDWHVLRGKPYMARAMEGLRAPRDPAMGLDAVGVVEAVGSGVTGMRAGDRVFGARGGAFAELVAGRNFVPMPEGLTFEQAAAIPVAATTALQAVRDHGEVAGGQRVLVTGAGGGVGTFAVQIAKARGARVTAATSASKADLLRSIGADDVIDYRAADITTRSERFDVVVDVGGYRRLRDLARLVPPGGTVVAVGPGAGQWIGPLAHMVALQVRDRLGRRRYRGFLAKVNRDDLLTLKSMVESGAVRPVIDRVYPLSEIRTAIARLEAGSATGKIVIRVAE